MSIFDVIQLALLCLGLGIFLIGQLQRWAVANHHDRLAMVTSAAGNAASRISMALSELPPGVDLVKTRSTLIHVAAATLLKEFDTTAPAISATKEKVERLISDKLGPAAVVPVEALGLKGVDALVQALGATGDYAQTAAGAEQVVNDALIQISQSSNSPGKSS